MKCGKQITILKLLIMQNIKENVHMTVTESYNKIQKNLLNKLRKIELRKELKKCAKAIHSVKR